MINNFFKIVPADIAYLSKGKPANKVLSDQEKFKITHAAIRVFAALGMALSLLKGTHAVLGNSLSKVIVYAGLYAVAHDVFVISLNSEKSPLQKVALVGQAIWNDVQDFIGGKKGEKDAPSHPLTQGTFFKPMWDSFFNSPEHSPK